MKTAALSHPIQRSSDRQGPARGHGLWPEAAAAILPTNRLPAPRAPSPRLVAAAFAFVWLVGMLDLGLSRALIRREGVQAEWNPVVSWLVLRSGPHSLLMFKVAGLAVFTAGRARVCRPADAADYRMRGTCCQRLRH